ncbi:leucine-rich repeat receptor-like protein kinase [Striga asiatica]|uniref:Leucine-rich repeat receptor-like protein kinase n=1 Tax=Striga asiatica TaxID=4170 RepID=A0A5A7QL94_STRAF|nr:leucine-rich repeat receptor-like protein kinase [Striga asiatica]
MVYTLMHATYAGLSFSASVTRSILKEGRKPMTPEAAYLALLCCHSFIQKSSLCTRSLILNWIRRSSNCQFGQPLVKVDWLFPSWSSVYACVDSAQVSIGSAKAILDLLNSSSSSGSSIDSAIPIGSSPLQAIRTKDEGLLLRRILLLPLLELVSEDLCELPYKRLKSFDFFLWAHPDKGKVSYFHYQARFSCSQAQRARRPKFIQKEKAGEVRRFLFSFLIHSRSRGASPRRISAKFKLPPSGNTMLLPLSTLGSLSPETLLACGHFFFLRILPKRHFTWTFLYTSGISLGPFDRLKVGTIQMNFFSASTPFADKAWILLLDHYTILFKDWAITSRIQEIDWTCFGVSSMVVFRFWTRNRGFVAKALRLCGFWVTYTISNSESNICHLAVRPARAGFSKRDFSGSNQLIGTIPKEVGNLTTLSVLNLNSNHLEGRIPTELGREILRQEERPNPLLNPLHQTGFQFFRTNGTPARSGGRAVEAHGAVVDRTYLYCGHRFLQGGYTFKNPSWPCK